MSRSTMESQAAWPSKRVYEMSMLRALRYAWRALRVIAGWRPLPREPCITARSIELESLWTRGTAEIRASLLLEARRDVSHICLWINPGFKLEAIDPPVRVAVREAWDPGLGIVRLKRIEIKEPYKKGDRIEVGIAYKGRALPLLNPDLGYSTYGHIYKQEVLWIPTPSCESLIPLLVSEYPRNVSLVARVKEGLGAAASMGLHPGMPGEFYGLRRGWAEPPSIIVAHLSTYVLGDRYRVHLHSRLSRYPPLDDIHEVLSTVSGYYKETWGLSYPYDPADIVIIPRGGGWTSGSMHVLDVRWLRSKTDLVIHLLHEYARAWWGMTLVPGDAGSYWMLEAVPDYAVLHGLSALGYGERAGKYLGEIRSEARRVLGSSRYNPPTYIPIPVTTKEHIVVRSIGALMLYELGETCGHRLVTGILGLEASGNKRFFTWSSVRGKLLDRCPDARGIMDKYRV